MTVGTQDELREFLRENQRGWKLAWKAREDYKLARLGMVSGAWSAFEMGEQAVEKLLKSFIVFRDPSAKVRELGHDTTACLEAACAAGLTASEDLERTAERLRELYRRRYPDIPGAPQSLSTGEVHALDRAVFEIWDGVEAIQSDYYFVSGLLVDVYGARLKPSDWADAQDRIVTAGNKAYAVRRDRLQAGIDERLRVWYQIGPAGAAERADP